MFNFSRSFSTLALSAAYLAQAGCSVVSPDPAWELFKATGSLLSAGVALGPTKASHTVYHLHAPFKSVCIEYNPQTQVPDVVPTLQAELRNHGIESRVYEELSTPLQCGIWLKYTANLDWGIPPFGDRYKPFVNAAALTLQTTNGLVLSTSSYQLDTTMGVGKWAPTREKLSPVVTALITGFEN